ncbi:MAG: DUF4249 domain-containing protein [Bacteroidales bacterium]|jgi:hypothetical protein|nr:DUF4249 domain-containing protein [Bacteroidales bacterium]
MNKILLITILILFVSLSSCHSLVEDEFDNINQIPVMNSLLQADSTFMVQVTLTANLTDSIPAYVSNAQVIIENCLDTPDTLIYTKKGWYTSSRIVKAGISYSCKVSIPNFPQMSAQTTVPIPTEIDSVIFTDLAGRGQEGEKISSVEFFIKNNPAQKQYWEVELVTEGLITEYNFETKEFEEYYGIRKEEMYMISGQDTVLLNEASPLTLFSNKLMTKNSYKVKFYINEGYTKLNGGVIPSIVLRSVDESYYKYVKQYYIYESASEINIGQSSQRYPLYSNIKNGLGIFTGISASKKELIRSFVGD